MNRAALHNLFTSLFLGDVPHLRRFIANQTELSVIASRLPESSVSLAEYVDRVIEQLINQNLMDVALLHLRTEFPRRRSEIEALRGGKVTSAVATAEPRRPPAGESYNIFVRNETFGFHKRVKLKPSSTIADLRARIQAVIMKNRELSSIETGFTVTLEFLHSGVSVNPNGRLSDLGIESGHALDLLVRITPRAFGQVWESRDLNFQGLSTAADDDAQELLLAEVFDHLERSHCIGSA